MASYCFYNMSLHSSSNRDEVYVLVVEELCAEIGYRMVSRIGFINFKVNFLDIYFKCSLTSLLVQPYKYEVSWI